MQQDGLEHNVSRERELKFAAARHTYMNNHQPLRLQCPVTALSVCSSFILAAQGSGVVLVDNTSGNTTSLEDVIPHQAIHGVLQVSSKGYLRLYFAWGGRYGRFISVKLPTSEGKPELEINSSLYCSQDWILGAATPTGSSTEKDPSSQDRVSVVSGHNALVLLNINYSDNGQVRFSIVELSEACRILLYCARISWINDKHILVTSGTALGQIIVWSCQIDREGQTLLFQAISVILLYSFDAHDGSVFGLDPVIFRSATGEVSQLVLCSCSDDRTIRIWDITPEFLDAQEQSEEAPQHQTYMFHDVMRTPQLLGKTWAHESRIWDIKSVLPTGEGTERCQCRQVFSFGEDASLQSWELELNGGGVVSIRHLGTFRTHAGKNIWSQTISDPNQHSWLVATGGADGAIVFTTLNKDPTKRSICTANSESLSRPLDSVLELGDKVKTYSFFSCDRIIVTTNQGRVLIGTTKHTGDGTASDQKIYICEDLGMHDELRGYSITAGLPEISVAFVASSSGDVYCHHPTGTFNKILTGKGKITGLYVYASDYEPPEIQGPSRSFYLLVAALGGSDASLLEFQLRGGILREQRRVLLEVRHGSLVTSFSALDAGPRLILLLGFRSGLLSIYEVPKYQVSRDSLWAPIEPSTTNRCHGDAITGIHAKYGEFHTKTLNILTTGRDSHFSIHEVDTEPNLHFQTVHRATIPLGPFIEGAYIRSRDQHLLFYGFKSTDFVIYNETEKRVISSVDCGGAHRVWAYQREQSASTSGTFVWTRSGRVKTVVMPESKSQIVRRGAHGREIRSCASSVFADNAATGFSSGLIATAAEDTDIRLYECRLKDGAVDTDCINIIRKHNTGLQHLEFGASGTYLFSCGSSEEFFVWRLRKAPLISLGIICEAALPPISELPDLRILDFKVAVVSHDPDSPISTPVFQITMVFSDSSIRTYRYSYTNKFQLLAAGSYGTSCLVQIDEIHLNPNQLSDSELKLGRSNFITGGTDGHLMLWHSDTKSPYEDSSVGPGSLQVFQRFKVHQNTIKCLITIPIHSNEKLLGYVIFTGGDDNAVGVTRLGLTIPELNQDSESQSNEAIETNIKDERLFCVNSILIPRAHAASISAMHIIGEKVEGLVHEWIIVSVGHDQRIIRWCITVDVIKIGADSIQVRRLGNEYTSIADVADMCLLPNDDIQKERKAVVVCGVGMEIRSFSQTKAA